MKGFDSKWPEDILAVSEMGKGTIHCALFPLSARELGQGVRSQIPPNFRVNIARGLSRAKPREACKFTTKTEGMAERGL